MEGGMAAILRDGERECRISRQVQVLHHIVDVGTNHAENGVGRFLRDPFWRGVFSLIPAFQLDSENTPAVCSDKKV